MNKYSAKIRSNGQSKLKKRSSVKAFHSFAASAAAIALFSAGSVSAAEYTIQIGAYEKPAKSLVTQASQLGEVNTALNDMGMTILTIGRYDTAREARVELPSIRETYQGAFIRAVPDSISWGSGYENFVEGSAPVEPASSYVSTSSGSSAAQTYGTDSLSSLTAEERRHAVYLDGVLRMKDGDSFMSLEEYRRTYGN